jgi:GTP-binding protein HflX
LKVDDKPTMIVFNKMDLYRERYFDDFISDETKTEIEEELKTSLKKKYGDNCMFVSAVSGEGMKEFRKELKEQVEAQYEIRYPYQIKFW